MLIKFILPLLFILNTMYVNGQIGKVQLISSELIFQDPPFESCHSSTLVQLPNGKIAAAWFGGKEEGNEDVCIWGALKTGDKWSKPVLIADGIINENKRYPCWNPVLFVNKKGTLFLFYKVGPSPREWWGMMRSSTDNGKNWSDPEKLPDGILGPIKNKPVQLANGDILYPSSTESMNDKTWNIHVEKTNDDIKNWEKIAINCDSFGVIQPTILQYPGNRLQMLNRSKQNAVVETWSSDNGKTWSSLKKTNVLNPNSGIDAVTLENGMQVLVYNPARKGSEWYNGRSRLNVAVSKDGENWTDVYELENNKKGEFSYPAIIQSNDGLVHISYTYDRKNIRYVVLKIPD